MSDSILIYGATGYTGRKIVEAAYRSGKDVIIAGRDQSKLERLAEQFPLPMRCFSVEDTERLESAVREVGCVLNAAGPFASTALPFINACLHQQVHYTDITGEFPIFAMAEEFDGAARAANVMLLPGVGWDVVPSDCLARHTADRVTDPVALRISLSFGGGSSRGSMKTAAEEIMPLGIRVRQDGKLLKVDEHGRGRQFDFGAGKGVRYCAPITMGDVVTAWKSTRIPNIEVYLALEQNDLLGIDQFDLPEGPTDEQLDGARSFVAVEVEDADGRITRSTIETCAAYTYTVESALGICERIQTGDFTLGFQTPASAYGSELALDFGQASYSDMD